MIKYGMIALGMLVTGGILWPVLSSILGDRPNEATQLVEATERTNNKAESLNDSFTDVIPPAPAGPSYYSDPASPVYVTRPVAQPGSGYTRPGNGYTRPIERNGQRPNEAGRLGNKESGEPGEPMPSPTPDKYTHSSEHAVRDAMEYLNRLQTEMQPTQTEYIQAVEQLQRAWNPRYRKAYGEYKRFARKIDHADAMAQEYFLVQQRLTAQIASPKDRRQAETIDAAEHVVYLDWRDQAFKTLGQAKLIMLDLHDMNIIIAKQSLSAHFAALYKEFQTIPPAITMLHEELARFREESDKIQQTFGVTVK